jgi:protein NrfD
MQELTITRHNALIDPSLHIWGWEIALYLFLGGMVAGLMIVSGYLVFRGRYHADGSSILKLPFISLALLSVGMLALFLDLEHRLYFWRMYVTFQPASPMSWGSWILLIVYPALLALAALRPPAFLVHRFPPLARWSDALLRHPAAIRRIAVANMTCGVLLGVYTGVLLSAFGARPLWNSALLAPLFLVSGLSTAAALVHMISKDGEEQVLLAKADNGFLTTELVILALFLIGLVSSTSVHQEAAMLLLNGAFAPFFWVFIVGLGLVVPLSVQLLAVNHRINHTPVAPVLVIAGGLFLRFVIVFAGQMR